MKNSPVILISLISLTFFNACKKDAAFTANTGGGNTNVPSCLISLDSNDQGGVYGNQFSLTYDGNGQVTKVTSSLSGSSTGTIDVSPTTIVRTLAAGTETYDFSKNIFTGNPDSYTFSRSTGGNFSAKLAYNGNGRLVKVQKFASGSTVSDDVDLSYDDKDNLTQIKITVGTGGGQTVYNATGYGDKNSPFYGQAGAPLLFYFGDFNSAFYPDFFIHLSRHNILGWSLVFSSGSETAAYTYSSFNPQDYPTGVTETITNVSTGNALTINDTEWTYDYNCK